MSLLATLVNKEWLDYLKSLVTSQAVTSSGSQFPFLNPSTLPPIVTQDLSYVCFKIAIWG